MLVKKQQLELDVEKQTGSKLGKEYIKVIFKEVTKKKECNLYMEYTYLWMYYVNEYGFVLYIINKEID